ncbi:hypothetical protein PWT90_03412 [Aphanocladium album]|nr:hypothetical protein PWT90_03412 [Aphanocladium album]
MASLLSGWLHGIVNDGPAKLPRRRKCALTPTPSAADLSLPPRRDVDATAASPLFQKLPAEIRIQILTAAFGARTLHMDVMLSYPPWRRRPVARDRAVPGHAGMFVEPSRDGRFFPVLDTTARQGWHWHGSICHRNPPGAAYADSSGHSVQPCQDQCRNGITPDDACKLWPGVGADKCRIGAMGWLQSCRQAYLEGIDILYGTNTIHTASKALILDADRLLLPQRLAAITSLEVLWDFGSHPPWADSFPGKSRELMETFDNMLRAVLSSFRGLKTLYISAQWTGREPVMAYDTRRRLGGGGGPGSDGIVERMLMQRIDRMVRQMPARVTEFTFAIPSSIYMEQCQTAAASGGGQMVEHISDGARYERFWRPVDRGAAHAGYWVRLGQRDLKLDTQSNLADSLLPHEWILYAQ